MPPSVPSQHTLALGSPVRQVGGRHRASGHRDDTSQLVCNTHSHWASECSTAKALMRPVSSENPEQSCRLHGGKLCHAAPALSTRQPVDKLWHWGSRGEVWTKSAQNVSARRKLRDPIAQAPSGQPGKSGPGGRGTCQNYRVRW